MTSRVAIPDPCPACNARVMFNDGGVSVCTECGWAGIWPGDDTADVPYECDGDFDTEEELPCVHADGCPGWDRCRVCYDREEATDE